MDERSAVFVSDVDGTLVHGEDSLNNDVLNALGEFKHIGDFTLSTGRGISSAAEYARLLGVQIPCILYGGAMIYDTVNDKVLYIQPMDRSITCVLKKLLEKEVGLSVTVYTEKYAVNLRKNDVLSTRGVKQDRQAPCAELSDIKSDIIKVLITHEDTEVLKRIKDSYFNSNIFMCTAASRHFYEVTARSVNKGRALSILCEILGYSSRYKFSAGDADTDLSMKPLSHKFYVPCTAQKHIIDHADLIIPSPENGGVAIALNDATRICTDKKVTVN